MKIAVIAHLKFPISQPYHGGLEMHTHILVEGLMAAGHDVTLFGRAESDERFTVVEPPLEAVTTGLGVDLFDDEPGYNHHFVNRFHSYMSIVQELQLGDFDIVHNNCLHFAPLAMAQTLSCPVVTVLHTPPFPSLLSGVLLAKSYLGNHFVAVSESLARTWSPHAPHCEVIHNGLRKSSWNFSPYAAPKTAVWCGRICPEKGPEHAIEAARLAGYRLRMVGTVYDEEYFAREIEPRLGDDVVFLGQLGHEELSAEIGRASVGLFTSTWDEPFGLVLIEMLACGTPVAAFDSGAVREILTDDCGTVVPVGDWVALADRLDATATLSRAACRARAIQDFPVDNMIAAYERLYQKLRKTVDRPVVSATPKALTDVA